MYIHNFVCSRKFFLFHFFSDIDECVSEVLNVCDIETRAACINTIGSFTCTCHSGYTGNGTHCIGWFTCTCTHIVCKLQVYTCTMYVHKCIAFCS